MKRFSPLLLWTLFFFSACRTVQTGGAIKADGKISVTFLQINDVYEIAPLSGGREGGIA
ncbi:MAG: bifunctional metallophosphatase/5'-nucleotidase, partial [Chitinophagaceae bacterium]